MSSSLQHRQFKIQAKRKSTPWRDFVMEICSRQNMVLGKHNNIISRYTNPQRSGTIVGLEEFNTIDCGDHTMNAESSDNFMTQLSQFFHQIPKASLMHFGANENCNYADVIAFSKNVYLSYHITLNSQNVIYSISVKESCDNVLNSMSITQSQNIYNSRGVSQSHNIFYSSVILDSSDMRYCDNCIGCHECINCHDLNSQSYMISNIQYNKTDYDAKKQQAIEQGKLSTNKPGNIDTNNSQGVGLIHCSNVEQGFFSTGIADSNNIILASAKETNHHEYDLMLGGGNPGEGHYYGGISCGGCTHTYCCIGVAFSSYCFYSYHMESCSFCLGCIGLKNKSYCILNKQYSKEERHEKVDEIFTQMETDGTLGDFFPASMNPFYFNDTAAYLIDPSFSREEARAKGYLWRDEPIQVDIPTGAEVVKTDELGQYEGWKDEKGNFTSLSVIARNEDTSDAAIQGIKNNGNMDPSLHSGGPKEGQQRYIDPSILKKIIQDPEGNVYRIVPMEYEFLMKHGLPLPRKHWLDRMKENFKI